MTTTVALENYILKHMIASLITRRIWFRSSWTIRCILFRTIIQKLLRVIGSGVEGSVYHHTPVLLEAAFDERVTRYQSHVAWYIHTFGRSLRGESNPVYLPEFNCYVAIFRRVWTAAIQSSPNLFHGSLDLYRASTFKSLSTSVLSIVRFEQFSNRSGDLIVHSGHRRRS